MAEPAPEARSRRSPASAPFSSAATRKRPSRRRARGARPRRGRAGTTARRSAAAARPARPVGAAWNAASPRRVNSGARQVERSALRLAAANRDDRGAGGERVQPLGRGGHAGADDRDASALVVRLVGVHGSGVAGELVRARRGPGWPGASEDVAEDAVAVELEAAVHGADALDARPSRKLSSQPVASRSSSTWARNSSTRRVVAVADALRRAGRRCGAARAVAHRQARERASAQQWPSLSERMRRCRIAAARAGARRPPGPGPCRRRRSRPARAPRAGGSRRRRSRRARRRRSRTVRGTAT